MKKLTLTSITFCLVWCSTTLFARDINCATSEELIAALSDLQDQDNIILTSTTTYIVQEDAVADNTTGSQNIISYEDKTITIKAAENLAIKPTIKGLSLAVTATTSVGITFENVILQAAIYKYDLTTQLAWYTDHLFDLGKSTTTALGNVIFRNCEIRNYGQTIIKANNMPNGPISGGTFLITGCTIADINNNGLAGGDALINMNKLLFNSITITNSTVYNLKTGFYRQNGSVSDLSSTFSMTNCTFNKFCGCKSSGTKSYFLYTNNGNAESSIDIEDNIFANIRNSEGIDILFYQIDGSALGSLVIANNNIFNCSDDNIQTKYSTKNATIENIEPALDPQFDNADNGSFYLMNRELADYEIGDPKWINIPTHVNPIQTETINIVTKTNKICINSCTPVNYAIYTINGRLISISDTAILSAEVGLDSGTYIVKTWSKTSNIHTKKIIL